MDSYVDAALRMQAACTAPSRTIVGNWVHGLPDVGHAGPNLDELHELVRFFDRWLKGIPNGADEEPAITWFEREYAEPEPFPAAWPGAGGRRPRTRIPATVATEWRFRGGSLPLVGGLAAGAERRRSPVSTATRTGRRSGRARRCRGAPADRPTGSRATSDPTRRSARPTRRSRSRRRSRSSASRRSSSTSSVSAPVATAVVRLTDVAPDGTSAQVTAGILNLTHRRSHVAPEPLEPGAVEEVRVAMRPAGYRFLPGHRIRVSVASSAWPVIWPSPYPGRPSSSTTAADPVAARPAGHPARRRPGRCAGAGLQDHAARRPGIRRRRQRRTSRSGGSRTTSSPGP